MAPIYTIGDAASSASRTRARLFFDLSDYEATRAQMVAEAISDRRIVRAIPFIVVSSLLVSCLS